MSEVLDLRLRCPCGEMLTANNEDALVAAVNQHLKAVHPGISGRYTREDILFMASTEAW
jgi:hypothetical protein